MGIAAFWRAAELGEFIADFRNERLNEIGVRVVACVFIALGIYFIIG